MNKTTFRALLLISLAATTLACGGNVVVDHDSSAGGTTSKGSPAGGGHSSVASTGACVLCGITCSGHMECNGDEDQCSCSGRCDGHRVRNRCSATSCSCFVDGNFIATCESSSSDDDSRCMPEDSCCKAFY